MAKKIRKIMDDIRYLTIVGIVVLALKLFAVPPVDDWPWWIVLAPFWAPVAVATMLVLAGFGVALVLLSLSNTEIGDIVSLKKKNKE